MSSYSTTFEVLDLNGANPDAWKVRVDALKGEQGLRRVFFGPITEDKNKGIVVARWVSAPPAQGDGTFTLEFGGSPDAALEAPTTEIFTGYGVEASFFDTTTQFLAKIDADPPKKGYFGGAVGKDVSGDSVKLLIGWDSKEAHSEAKVPGCKCPLEPAEGATAS